MTDIVPAGGYEAGLALTVNGRTSYARGTVFIDPNTGNVVPLPGSSSSNPTITQAAPPSYTLATNGTPNSANPQTVNGGTYALVLPQTFNGATIAVTFTDLTGVATTVSYTSRPATTPRFDIYAGTTASVAITNGTPTGNTVLAGGPTSSAYATQNVQTPIPASVQASRVAVTATPTALSALSTVNGTQFQAGGQAIFGDGSTAIIWIGGSNLANSNGTNAGITNGFPLANGQSTSIASADRSNLYVCVATGTGVGYVIGN